MMNKREEAARAVRDNLPSRAFLTDLESLKVFDAVIACIREPDEKMITAAGKVGSTDKMGNKNNYRRRKKAYWQAMLDAMT